MDRGRDGDGCAYGKLEEEDGPLGLEVGAARGGGEEPPILPAHRLMKWTLVLMGCWPAGRGWLYLLWSLLVGLTYPACMALDIRWWPQQGVGPATPPEYLHTIGELLYLAQMFAAFLTSWRVLRDREADRQVRAALANQRVVADWWFRFGCLLSIIYLVYAGYLYTWLVIELGFQRCELSRVAFLLFIYVYNFQFVASGLLFAVCALHVRDRIVRFVEPLASSGAWSIGKLTREFEAVCRDLEVIGDRFNFYLSACNGGTLLRYVVLMATPREFSGTSQFLSEVLMLLRVAVMVGFIDFAGALVASAATRLQPRLVHWRDPSLADESDFLGMPANIGRPMLTPLAGGRATSGGLSFGAVSAPSSPAATTMESALPGGEDGSLGLRGGARQAPPSASLVGPPPAGTAASVTGEAIEPPCTNTSMAAVAAYASAKMLRISHDQQLLLHTCTVLENRDFRSLKVLGVALTRKNLFSVAYIVFGLSMKFGLGKALMKK